MRNLKRIVAALAAALIGLVAVVLIRTLTYKTPVAANLSGVKVAPAIAVDVDRAAQHLSQAVQIQTVSNQDKTQDQLAEWDRLHAFLQATYPAAHAAMTREVVGRKTLIYTWKGSDPALAPVILMAHQDVVPVTPGTEKDWTHPPFSGAVAGGAVWGRGSIDDKGQLIAIFEGLETLAKQGFKPKRTLIVLSTEDEEVGGTGARAAEAALAAQKIKAQFVVDEGLAVITNNPVTGGRLAMIGTAEKGYGTIRVTAKAEGGHSSAPPADGGGVANLSRAILAITGHDFPLALRGPAADMLETLAPQAPFMVRMAVANRWLFGSMIAKKVGATPSGASLLHTTIAPTMLKGSPKENVLAQDPQAWINYRLLQGDASEAVMAKAKAAVAGLPVTLAWENPPFEASPISSTSSEGWRTLAAVTAAVTGAPVAPSLVTAGTDSRFMTPVAQDSYRFQPEDFALKDIEMIHGTNEHMTLKNLAQAVQFYARLVATAVG